MFENTLVFLTVMVALVVDIVGAIYLLRIAHRSPQWIEEIVNEWRGGTLLDKLVSKDEEGNVLMDERLVAVIDGIGARMMQSFKMSALQGLSVNAKLEKGLKGAFAADILDNKMPILNLLGDFMGYNVKSYVAKNPNALMQLLSMPQVQGFLGNVMGNNGGRQPSQSANVPLMR